MFFFFQTDHSWQNINHAQDCMAYVMECSRLGMSIRACHQSRHFKVSCFFMPTRSGSKDQIMSHKILIEYTSLYSGLYNEVNLSYFDDFS